MSTRLIAKLRGGAAEREAAYAGLLRREALHNAKAGSGASSTASVTRDPVLALVGPSRRGHAEAGQVCSGRWNFWCRGAR